MLRQQTEQQTNEYQKVKNKKQIFSDTKCYSGYFTFAWHNRFCCV